MMMVWMKKGKLKKYQIPITMLIIQLLLMWVIQQKSDFLSSYLIEYIIINTVFLIFFFKTFQKISFEYLAYSLVSIILILFISISLFTLFNKELTYFVFEKYPNNLSYRLWNWKAALILIKENWLLGVGNQNINKMLEEVYTQNELPLWFKLNEHNQYFRTILNAGILGLIAYFLIIFNTIRKAIMNNNFTALSFGFLILLSSLSESILERRYGVLFFGFYIAFFSANLYNNNINYERD